MLTRSQVAKRLGKSIATVRRMEGSDLHPKRDERGVFQFDFDEVEAIARAERGGSARVKNAELAGWRRGSARRQGLSENASDQSVPVEEVVRLRCLRGQIERLQEKNDELRNALVLMAEYVAPGLREGEGREMLSTIERLVAD